MTPSLSIAASSMLTPLGNSTARVYCAIEAGINRYHESDILSSDEQPIKMALVPRDAIAHALDHETLHSGYTARQKRLLRLAIVALNGLKPQLPKQPLALLMAGPAEHNSDPNSSLSDTMIASLSQQCDIPLDIANSRILNHGRSGALEMIRIAEQYFANTNHHYAIVGGVDSYYDVATLDQLDDQQRLLLSTSKSGMVPGEGAGFVLLISPTAPESIQATALAQLSPCVMTHDKTGTNGHTTPGNALSTLFAQLATHQPTPAATLYSSANGEHHHTAELSIAMLRYRDSFSDNKTIICPAEYSGDIGAALGAVMLGLAAQTVHKQQHAAPPHTVLLYCASDNGVRAGLCVAEKMGVNEGADVEHIQPAALA